MTEKIKALINKRLNEQAEIRESLGTGFPIEEDAKLRKLAALELVLDDLKSLVFEHQPVFAVGEYYRVLDSSVIVFTQLADGNFKVMKDGEFKTYDVINFNSQFIGSATAEQIATFKRAEQEEE